MSSPLMPLGAMSAAMPGRKVQPVQLPENEQLQDHPIEWWYFIAFLDGTKASDRFAMEMTAARLSVSPLRAVETVYLALIDLTAQEYLAADRQSLGAYRPGLGRVCLLFEPSFGQPGTWRVDGWTSPTLGYELDAAFAVTSGTGSALRQRAIHLELTDGAQHPPLKHGPNLDGVIDFHGLEMAHYSRTKLDVSGALKLDARHVAVSGYAWMDHEWGTGDLPGSRWTFVAIQLDSGEEYCAYQVDRRYENKQGKTHGYRVAATGVEYATAVTLAKGAVEMPTYGYPLEWDVAMTFANGSLALRVSAAFPEQRRVPSGELALPYVTLWEGAAIVTDPVTGTVIGRAFLEMGGYE